MSTNTPYRKIRDLYRLTQEQLAGAFGVSRAAVSLWESGATRPPPAVHAAYRQLQEPLRTGDLNEVERLRTKVIDTVARAPEEARRLNDPAASGSLVKTLSIAAGAVAIGMLLAALFSDE